MKYRFPALFHLAAVGLAGYLATGPGGHAALPDNNPVPGGVVVAPLYDRTQQKPEVMFGDKDVLVTADDTNWIAVIGLSQDMLPGKYILTFKSASDLPSKKSFRIKPLPASQSRRTMNLPVRLSVLEFTPMDTRIYSQLIDNDLDDHIQIEPEFDFRQMVNAGSYIPYGWLINQQGRADVIKHPRITYITRMDEIVNSPAVGVVEKIFLSDTAGLTVVLNHGKGMKSIIGYLNDTILKLGEMVESGEVIGTTKTVADGAGAPIGRVDWQLMLNGYLIDPLQFSPAS